MYQDHDDRVRQAAAEQLEDMPPEAREEVKSIGAVLTGDDEAPPSMMRIDLHCHSEASADCITPLTAFPQRCLQRDIRIQAVTDHNEIWGAQKLQEMVAGQGAPLTIIVGEEVSTNEGEIVGLYLTEKIPAGLTPEETVDRIVDQGGLVLLPHGFERAHFSTTLEQSSRGLG